MDEKTQMRSFTKAALVKDWGNQGERSRKQETLRAKDRRWFEQPGLESRAWTKAGGRSGSRGRRAESGRGQAVGWAARAGEHSVVVDRQ